MVVHTELRTNLSQAFEQLLNAACTRLKRSRPKLHEVWQLTLYHHGRLTGRYQVPIHPLQRGSYYSEHLAFTADGHYLAWIIETGDGDHFYVFPTD